MSKVYTTKEVADTLGVHQNTVRTMAKDGRLASFKTKDYSGHLRFREEDVEKFKAEHELSTVSPNLIKETHMYFSSNKNDMETVESWLDTEYVELFRYLLASLEPSRLFGIYLDIADNQEYSEMLKGKAHRWVAGGLSTMDVKGSEMWKTELIGNRVSIGLGSVNLGYYQKPLTAVVIFKCGDRELVLDGTLQQFIPTLDKGVVVMDRKVAESFYIKLTETSLKEYHEAIHSEAPNLLSDILEAIHDSEFSVE